MTRFDEQRFLNDFGAALDQGAAAGKSQRGYVVAFSGGIDSSVLLAAAVRVLPVSRLRALHVDHGLQREAAVWAHQCENVAQQLGIPFQSLRVEVARNAGRGLEAAAREARYGALAARIEPGETLLTAHHADDQFETLILRLLRGTGVRGLRGIRVHASLGVGFVVRPLLGFTRAQLREAAAAWGLVPVEDPSNLDVSYDRNYVRREALPILTRRWPAAAHAARRLAAAATDAEAILAEVATADLDRCRSDSDMDDAREVPGATNDGRAARRSDGARTGSASGVDNVFGHERPSGRRGQPVPVRGLQALSPARLRNVLRHAIGEAGFPIPDWKQIETLRESLGCDPLDSRLAVQWPNAEARLYRGCLYFLETLPTSLGPRAAGFVSVDASWSGVEGTLALDRVTADDPDGSRGCLPDSLAREGLEVRFRSGGERFKPLGSAHHRKLKHWFQERAIVPWMREHVPLLYWRGQLVAIADLEVTGDLPVRRADEQGWRVRWNAHPPIK